MKQAPINDQTIELTQGDITEQNVAVIVNAANSRLAGGGGVDGAIHRAGGPSIMRETDRRYPDGCPSGSAVISAGGNLPARYVIHAVGPVWSGGRQSEAQLLASAHQKCLELAIKHQCQSIAFPAISTGVYGYPVELAAEVALSTVRTFLLQNNSPRLVRFVLFSSAAYAQFEMVLDKLQKS